MKRDTAGFTLVEIMVAIVILAASLLVLVQAHSMSISTLQLARDEVIKRNLVDQAIGYAEVGLYTGQLTDSKEFNKRFEGYKWTYEATLTGDELNPLYDVTVRIDVPDGDPIEFSFMVFVGEPYAPSGT